MTPFGEGMEVDTRAEPDDTSVNVDVEFKSLLRLRAEPDL